jgi:hypothetical protein
VCAGVERPKQNGTIGTSRQCRSATCRAMARGGKVLRKMRECDGHIEDAVQVFDEMPIRVVLENARVLLLGEASRVQDAVGRTLRWCVDAARQGRGNTGPADEKEEEQQHEVVEAETVGGFDNSWSANSMASRVSFQGLTTSSAQRGATEATDSDAATNLARRVGRRSGETKAAVIARQFRKEQLRGCADRVSAAHAHRQ